MKISNDDKNYSKESIDQAHLIKIINILCRDMRLHVDEMPKIDVKEFITTISLLKIAMDRLVVGVMPEDVLNKELAMADKCLNKLIKNLAKDK